MGRDIQAQSALNKAMLTNPNRGINYFSKGEICMEKKQYQAAIEYFLQAAKYCGEEGWEDTKIASMRNIGNAYMQLDDYNKALPMLPA